MTEIITKMMDANGEITKDVTKAVSAIQTELDDQGNMISETFLVPEDVDVQGED